MTASEQPNLNRQALSDWLVATYDLPLRVTCQLIRSYTNDVYLIKTPETQYVLKVYGLTWRTEGEVRYEIALLQHLLAKGMTTPAPIPGKDSDFVRQITTIGGDSRLAVLFAYAPGVKPQPPFTPSLYVAFGEAVARMHSLSDDFVSAYPRCPLDFAPVIDEPLALVAPLLEQAADRDFLTTLAGRVKDRIASFAGLDWGPIHGDATLDNLHVTADGEVVLFDFDSGGPGWRAADLQGWTVLHEEYREKGEAFRSGYSHVRQLNEVDIDAIPFFLLAWNLWGMKIDLQNRILSQGEEAVQAYLRDQLTQLRESDARFPWSSHGI